MVRRIIIGLLILAITFSGTAPSLALTNLQDNIPGPVTEQMQSLSASGKTGEYIVKLKNKNSKTKNQVLKQKEKDKKFREFQRLNNVMTVTLTEDEANQMRKDPEILYVEEDSFIRMSAWETSDTVTHNVYQVHAPEVHALSYRGGGVKVAVMDTGIKSGLSDLSIAGGVSFVSLESSSEDLNGHGTFIAGILAALANDSGIIGIAPDVELYNIKVLDQYGIGTYGNVIHGIEWAIDNGIDILSMSFVGERYSAALEEAVQLAYNHGILLVAATGNEGVANVLYPAKFDSVIAVGAVDSNNVLAPFSNKGPEVELVAPGLHVQSLSLDGNVIRQSGTSMAVPHVVGIAALAKQKHRHASNQNIRTMLQNSATPLGDAEQFGYGAINGASLFDVEARPYFPQDDEYSPPAVKPKLVMGGSSASVSNSDDGPSVADSVYGEKVTAAGLDYPTTYDQVALRNVNLQTNQAPFSLFENGEQISTLDGSLSLSETDFVLPGRNGLSFALTRTYSSASAQLYDMDVESKPIFHYRVYPFTYVVYDRLNPNNTISYMIETRTMNQVSIGFNPPTCTIWTETSYSCEVIGSPKYEKQYFENGTYYLEYSPGMYWYCNAPVEQLSDCYEWAQYTIDDYSRDHAIVYYSEFFGPSSAGNHYRLWASLFPTSQYSPLSHMAYVYTGIFNKKVEKTYQESLFPIGKGWSWNISSIEYKQGKKYLHLAGNGTYEINGSNQLVGYPWKDLTFSNNVLTSLDGIQQHFGSDGRLTKITDAYGNATMFTYTDVNPYGKVLTDITDAIGNSISISYTTSDVVVKMGDKTVTYTKSVQWEKEFLVSVKNPLNLETQYTYSWKPASFNFSSNTSQNQPMSNPYGLLTGVSYPTGALTNYTYESAPVTRAMGPGGGYNQAYRLSGRADYTATEGYLNRKTVTYSGDVGSSYGANYSFSTTIDDELTQKTYTNYKQHIHNDVPPSYYTTEMHDKPKNSNLVLTTENVFDYDRRLPAPTTTSTKYADGAQQSAVRTMQWTYDDYGNVLTETDPQQATTVYAYDPGSHLLSSIAQPISPHLTSFTQVLRNAKGKITQIAVRDNGANGAIKSQIDFEYDMYGNSTKLTLSEDNQSTVINQEFGEVYAGGYVTKVWTVARDADGQSSTIQVSMEYDKSTGQMTRYTDGNAKSTNYVYDAVGRVKSVAYPDLGSATVDYDDIGNRITVTDQVGVRTVMQWNAIGWKKSEGIAGSGTMTYGYDAYGRMTSSRDARGNTTYFAYDSWHRLIGETYPNGAQPSIAYDDIRSMVTTTDGEGHQIRESFDILGRKSLTEQWKDSAWERVYSYSYDYAGQPIVITDGEGYATTYEYDALNRLEAVMQPDNATTRYRYTVNNKVAAIAYADGQQLRMEYDELGRMIRRFDPTGAQDKYYYDGNGNLTRKIDRNQRATVQTFDAMNRLLTSMTPSEMITYTYDKAGNRLSMQDRTGTTTYVYNTVTGYVSSVTYPDSRTIRYGYDAQGNRTSLTDPFNHTVGYTYDSLNRLSAVTNYAAYTYLQNNQLSLVQRSDGIRTSFAYKDLNLAGVAHTNASGVVLGSMNYQYDRNMNIIGKEENGSAYDFTYDKLNRIDSSSQLSEQYGYDLRGNRVTLSSERAIDWKTGSYQYDNRNRLTQVQLDNGETIQYVYNGDGLLYERRTEGNTTRYYYDGGLMIAEGSVVDNGTAILKARYIYGADGLTARVDAAGNTAYYLKNGHGDVIGLTNSSGTMLNQYTYDIWGYPLTAQETVENPFRYSGEYWDDSTGLQYLRARWYDPSIGRFMNEDTYEGSLANPLSQNLYTYVHNNPVFCFLRGEFENIGISNKSA